MTTHPLTTTASWQLSAGGRQAGVLRLPVMALWLASAITLMVWASALITEASIWSLGGPAVTLALALFITWMLAAWRTWRRWHETSTALTLEWTGLPANQSKRAPDPASVGFRVRQWQAPAHVQMVLDLQSWVLLRVQAISADEVEDASGLAWVWLDMRRCPGCDAAALHQLRTLLLLPQRMRSLAAHKSVGLTGRNTVVPIPMASWETKFKPGSMLSRPVNPGRAARRSARAASKADSLFPPTHVMDGWTSHDSLSCDHKVRS